MSVIFGNRRLRLLSIARRLNLKHIIGLQEDDLEWVITETLRSEGIPSDELLVTELRSLGLIYAVPLQDDNTMQRILETEGIILKLKSPCGKALERHVKEILTALKTRGKCTIHWDSRQKNMVVKTTRAGRPPAPENDLKQALKKYYADLKAKNGGKASGKGVVKGLRILCKNVGAKMPVFTSEGATLQQKALQYYLSLIGEVGKDNKKLRAALIKDKTKSRKGEK